MKSVFSADEISVSYGSHNIINELSFAADRGEFVGILGPNGCGKTTLLKTFSKILSPIKGTVIIEDTDINELDSKNLAKKMACVSQDTDVAFAFTVKEIVLMGRNPHIGRVSPLTENDYKIVEDAMRITNVSHLSNRFITEISGGERQRVLIARALAQQPDILLLDEPTSHLDINHQIEILSMIHDLTPRITVIGVFHDLSLASYFCDRIILMKSGKIIASGTPEEVITSDLIYDTFSIRMMVFRHPVSGKPYLVPEYGTHSNAANKKIHIVSGGGSGTNLMYNLCIHGYSVTAGVLSVLDTDYKTASAMKIPVISEPPFSNITEKSLKLQKNMFDESDMIVVISMPVGFGNISNLKSLMGYESKLYIVGDIVDFTDGEADSVLKKLIEDGACLIKDISEFLKKVL